MLKSIKKYAGVGCLATMLSVSASIPAALADLMVPVSRSQLIELPVEMGEVIVANPEVADIYVHGKDKVTIIGKSLGRTTVRIFDANSKLIRAVEVTVGYDLPAIRKTLKEFLPYENGGVEMINTNIALTGQVSSVSSADKAMRIVDEFVSPAFGASAADDKKDGDVSKVINLMSITAGQQVMLRVRVGEMRRTALKNIGVNLQSVGTGTNTLFQVATGGGIDAFVGGSGLGFGQYAINRSGDSPARGILSGTYTNSSGNGVSALLEALEEDGLFKVLAEPNLVAVSGESAQFLAGGEFPIPISQNDGEVSIEFKPFGVSVDFTPVVLSESRIRIQVEPEVSEISDEGAVSFEDGLTIPAIATRRAKTTVELSPGESFMIAGLIQDEMQSTIRQVPGISEIPILSALFRSTAYKREETELVLAITPYLVDPMVSGDVKLPTDQFKPASVMESFFYGALGSLSDDAERISQTPSLEGPIGFMVD